MSCADSKDLDAARKAARTPAAILDVIARISWAVSHKGAVCPKNRIPTEPELADLLASRPEERQPITHKQAQNIERSLAADSDKPAIVKRMPADGWSLELQAEPDPDAIDPDAEPDFDGPGVKTPGRLVVGLMWRPSGDDDKDPDAEPPGDDSPALCLAIAAVDDAHVAWLSLPVPDRPTHFLAPIIRAWQGKPQAQQPEAPSETTPRLIVTTVMEEKRDRKGKIVSPHLVVTRTPGAFDVALTATEAMGEPFAETTSVDGEPFATAVPNMFQRMKRPDTMPALFHQGELSLFPAPLTLDDTTADPVMRLLAGMSLTGDERNTLRSDVVAISRVIFALTGPMICSPEQGAAFIGGKDTPANRRRWLNGIRFLRYVDFTIDERTGVFLDLAAISILKQDGTAVIGPPAWWTAGDGPKHYRLTAGLLRPTLIGASARGPGEGYWSSVDRTVDGIEAALSYGSVAGRGRGGRIPDTLRPADGRKTGPGPKVFLPWDILLRLSGEHVPADAVMLSKYGQRYRDRVKGLDKAGYMTRGNLPAKTGYSVEIVEIVKGSPHRKAGVWVRATARFVEARRRGNDPKEWTRIPLFPLLNRNPRR